MFFCILVRHRLSPTATDNILTWDKDVLVAALVARLEINFVRLLISVIHERAFKTTTAYSLACMIFQLCRNAGVPIYHCDVLRTPPGIVDIGLIRDEANVVAPWRKPKVNLQWLGENLVDTVEQDKGMILPL